MRPPAVIVHGPIPNRHVQMALVEWNQEVETFATKAAAQSLAHRVRLWGPHRRTQNLYTQICKTLVDICREDAVTIVDDEAVPMIAGSASRNCCSVHSSVEGRACPRILQGLSDMRRRTG